MSERTLFPEEIVGLLADPVRRKVVGALTLQESGLDDLAAAAATSAPEVGKALTRLEQAGLINRSGAGWRLHADAFEASVRAAAAFRTAAPDDERALLFRRFFYRGRLVAIPERPDDVDAVLGLIADDFEVGETFDEVTVNNKLSVWFDDWCTLRRALVDHRFLQRDHGRYWRPAGPPHDF